MPRSPIRFLLLAILLFATWLLLSGIYHIPRLNITGAVTCVIIAWIVDRARLLDLEALPLALVPRGLAYWPWLGWEIVKSALNVTRIILSPKMPISPTMITFTPTQKTDVGLATHGNSITLTPGTITTGISSANKTIQVHGIERSGAEGCAGSDMDKKVSWFEGKGGAS